jgi:hypothetical protein
MGDGAKSGEAGQRTNAVEREILRCVALGEIADFTAGTWSRVKKVGGRPVVKPRFLVDLWLGVHPVRVHPFGIRLDGLHVDGPLVLDSARVDHRLRSPLVRFHATNCCFAGGLIVDHSRCESLLFASCRFTPGAADGSMASDDADQLGHPPPVLVSACSSEIVGKFIMIGCTVEGTIRVENTILDDDLRIASSTIAGHIDVGGSEVRGGMGFTDCTVHGSSTQGSIVATLCEVQSQAVVRRCWLAGGISFSQAELQLLGIEQSRVGAPGIILESSTITDLLALNRLRVHGSVSLNAARLMRQMHMYANVFGAAASVVFDLRAMQCRGDIWISHLRVKGYISGAGLATEGQLTLQHCTISPGGALFKAIDLSRSAAVRAEISDSTLAGALQIDDASFGSFALRRTMASWSGSARELCNRAQVEPHGLATSHSLSALRLGIATNLEIWQCAFPGKSVLSEMRVGGRAFIGACWLGEDATDASLELTGSEVVSLFTFSHCVAPAGIDLIGSSMSELQFIECRIGNGNPRNRGHRMSLWASNITVGRGITFYAPTEAKGARGNLLHGVLSFEEASVGTCVDFLGIQVTLDPIESDDASAVAIGLYNAQVGSFVWFGSTPRRDPSPEDDRCFAHVQGAVGLDGLVADRIGIGPGTKIASCSSSGRNDADPNSRRIMFSKHGVALSLRTAKIAKRITVAADRMEGRIDLRDAFIGTMADRGGGAWGEAGVGQGKMLLDGLTYANLDDDDNVATDQRQGSTANPAGVVERRLSWIAMQYPDGQADAKCFLPQPYEQLARHYAALGDERARRQVLVRKRQLQRRHSGLSWIERGVSGLLGVTSNYGYSPGRATIASLLLIAVGALAAWGLDRAGAVVPQDLDAAVGPFSPLLFAIDVAVPFLDLGHDGAWRIDPGQLPQWPGRTLAMGLAEALYRLAGLVMLSITVLTFSGILHEKD